MNLNPFAVERRNQRIEYIRLDVCLAAITIGSDIRLKQRRRVGFDHAVRKNLYSSGAQSAALILLSHFSESRHLRYAFRRINGQRSNYAGGQLAAPVKLRVSFKIPLAHRGILKRSDAEAICHLKSASKTFDVIFRRILRQVLLNQSHRIFAQRTCGFARSGVALDAARFWIRRILCYSGYFESARIRPGRVAVGGIQKDRAIRDSFIEQRFLRIGVWEKRKLPARPANPFLLRILLRVSPHSFKYLLLAGEFAQLAFAHLYAAGYYMHVRIVKARQQHLASQIHDDSLRANPCLSMAVRADINYAAMAYCDRFGP